MGSLDNSKIKTRAYFLAIAALLSAVLSYMSTVSMGFPDGHLTEFERAVKPLLIGYSIIALLFGTIFYGLARFSSKIYSKAIFYTSLALFILIVIGLGVLYFYFSSKLNHGGGG